jgi:hypothetical protein
MKRAKEKETPGAPMGQRVSDFSREKRKDRQEAKDEISPHGRMKGSSGG